MLKPGQQSQKVGGEIFYNIKNKAFTLVELIITIVILVILATIAFINLSDYPTQARETKILADLKNLEKAMELYFIENGKYPEAEEINGEKYFGELSKNELKNIFGELKNPETKNYFNYELSENKREYKIFTKLEETGKTYEIGKMKQNLEKEKIITPENIDEKQNCEDGLWLYKGKCQVPGEMKLEITEWYALGLIFDIKWYFKGDTYVKISAEKGGVYDGCEGGYLDPSKVRSVDEVELIGNKELEGFNSCVSALGDRTMKFTIKGFSDGFDSIILGDNIQIVYNTEIISGFGK